MPSLKKLPGLSNAYLPLALESILLRESGRSQDGLWRTRSLTHRTRRTRRAARLETILFPSFGCLVANIRDHQIADAFPKRFVKKCFVSLESIAYATTPDTLKQVICVAVLAEAVGRTLIVCNHQKT